MVQYFVQLEALFKAVQQIDPNQFNNYLILGYGVMWAVVMVYLVILANRQKNAREDLKLLAQLIKEDEEQLMDDEGLE